ncbi:MAG: Na/Pi cotransporter family protein [Dysgonamonadaceae bacterium]|jgi:phosphate:Na+ symporter|nr:Na/Pi cotransporter family protein [Dysgonamonadaceae bacterium]
MSYSFLDFLKLIGALGMFLYGMKIMSEGLQKVAGDKLRNILSVMTTNRFTGVLTGVLITALIQSSSATTVMVVSFVNAGLLSLTQSISVIMGANVGTTVTAWIISILGFKFDISVLALPLIGLSLPLIFSVKNKRKSWGEFIIGFALLFMGLDFLKASVPDLQTNPEMLAFLRQYTDMGFGSILLFLLIGTILTIIVQSSSATVAITLIMCSQGWISFEIACAMVLGENIGTTVTANIAALSANVSARRAALAHLMFNIFGVIWVAILFYPFTGIVSGIVNKIGPGDPYALTSFLHNLELSDPATFKAITSDSANLTEAQLAIKNQMLSLQISVSYGLSLFHTMFNIINVLIMIGFVKVYVLVCTKLIPNKESDEEFQLKYISSSMLSTAELGIIEAKSELISFAERTERMYQMVKELRDLQGETDFVKLYGRIEKYENISDRMEVEIANYLNRLSEGRLSSESKEEIRDILRANAEMESVADSLCNLARVIKRRNEARTSFPDELNNNIDRMYDLCHKAMTRMVEVIKLNDPKENDAIPSYNIEAEINHLRNRLKMNNLEDVNAHKYDYEVGVFYMDYITECERLGDFVINVVEAFCINGIKSKF